MRTSFSAPRPCANLIASGVACALLLMTPMAQAADPVRASTAATVAAADNGKAYQVKPGDTLDKVVRNALADSPLRADVLKEEIVKMNPHAFTKGSKSTLMAGATLHLPRNEDLLGKHLKAAQDAVGTAGRESATSNERRNWVRYP